ncbi:competence protein CoiA family protein [Burkholderia sp. MSMB1078WGS]|uniref:competence protein CoiA family protein n=1 Tax=Burkholderia sp. MSMB1078WGS TaxID=1637900 RepID=UPI0015D0AB59|nr:competence protein CoiA family protein [Burkholderia sp. MSMB1078WGS]
MKCLSPDGPVHAFDYSRERFELLRLKHNSQRHLSFKCCAGQVGLRVSSTGFQHFYHVKRGGCRYEGESLEHLQAKAAIAQAARQAGWSVELEAEDEQGCWQADVLLSRGSVRLAFEVQWSAQTWAETLLRQQRYADSKVQACGCFVVRRMSRLSRHRPSSCEKPTRPVASKCLSRRQTRSGCCPGTPMTGATWRHS